MIRFAEISRIMGSSSSLVTLKSIKQLYEYLSGCFVMPSIPPCQRNFCLFFGVQSIVGNLL